MLLLLLLVVVVMVVVVVVVVSSIVESACLASFSSASDVSLEWRALLVEVFLGVVLVLSANNGGGMVALGIFTNTSNPCIELVIDDVGLSAGNEVDVDDDLDDLVVEDNDDGGAPIIGISLPCAAF